MKIWRRGDQVWIRVDMPRGAYTELVVTKHGPRVEISMDALYGEEPRDVEPQLEALRMALTIGRMAERNKDWLEAVSGLVGG